MWGFQRGRWFTVSLVWANDPGRVLSEPRDVTCMAAFSNSVMAEVSRMDLEAADRAKGDYISFTPHELRSLLHGGLGTAELLQETVTTYIPEVLGRDGLELRPDVFGYAQPSARLREDQYTHGVKVIILSNSERRRR